MTMTQNIEALVDHIQYYKAIFTNGRACFLDAVIADDEKDADNRACEIIRGISDNYPIDNRAVVEIVGPLATDPASLVREGGPMTDDIRAALKGADLYLLHDANQLSARKERTALIEHRQLITERLNLIRELLALISAGLRDVHHIEEEARTKHGG